MLTLMTVVSFNYLLYLLVTMLMLTDFLWW